MSVRFERIAEFRAELEGCSLLRASIDPAGRAVLAGAPPEINAGAVGAAAPAGACAAAPYPLTVLIGEGSGWERRSLEAAFIRPHVQPLPGGNTLVAGTYSRRANDGEAELNAVVHGPDGAVLRRFLLGDGIDAIQSTGTGELWVSYSYAGVMGDYGRRGWGRLSPDEWIDPVGVSGLVRFDAHGTILFEFSPPSGLHVMTDCYALNAWAGEVWASYHPNFPLVRVNASGQVEGWPTESDNVINALAVAGDRVLLHGDGRNGRHRWWSARFDHTSVRDLVELDVTLGDGAPLDSLDWVVGRGTALHAFSASVYYRLDVDELG